MKDEDPQTPDVWHYIGYGLAAAIMIPLGMHLKANYARDVGEFILSGGGLFY